MHFPIIKIILEIFVFLLLLTVLAMNLGRYIRTIFFSHKIIFTNPFRPIEKFLYLIFGVDENETMDWKTYTKNLVIFTIIGIIFLFIVLKIQESLPLNPESFKSLNWDQALNIAVSFATNTDWQSYSPESTLSYFTQMLGLTVQNFLSAGIGISAAIVLIRAFTQKSTNQLGNFWVDLTRSIVYLLLPFSILFTFVLVSQGVIQNLNPYVEIKTLEGATQVIAQGPAASQIAIKHLGTNGGGFFNANSAHPYEDPTPLTDYLQILMLLLIPASLIFTFGFALKKPKQAWVLYFSIVILFLMGTSVAIWAEFQGNPLLEKLGIEHGANMEGKEIRFGILNSVFFSQSTTATACGAVNNVHASLMPITSLVLMFNMMTGEVIFGGVGVGFIEIIAYGILTLFLMGLMIGRTPEIFGKKLEAYEMIMTVCLLLLPSLIQLILGAIAITSQIANINQSDPYSLSQIIYTFASGTGNNGSGFASLEGNTLFYNISMAIATLLGRFAIIVPALAIAGSLIEKKQIPLEVRFPTETPLFACMLISVIIIVGSLTFFPILTMGPFLEHLFLQLGKVF